MKKCRSRFAEALFSSYEVPMRSSRNYPDIDRIITNRTLTRLCDRIKAGWWLCAVFFVLYNHNQWIKHWLLYFIRYP